ncbi:MAG TPA: hypothetical protein VIH99_08365 [Bdellovibrionota bacterium]|jgi:hypothetical protein
MDATDRLGKYSGLLAVAETGLGSLLHAYHVPLAGHFLSLNQGFLLSRYVDEERTGSAWSPYKASLMAAAMKSLSPLGKRLTPMLGISVQGLLYSLGVFLFGMNLVGALVGALLLSVWAFFQPALTLFIVFGSDLFSIAQFYHQEAQKIFHFDLIYLGYVILALFVLKMLLAGVLVALAFSSRKHQVEEKLIRLSQVHLSPVEDSDKQQDDSAWGRLRLVGKDLLQPLFLFSLLLSFGFFYLTNPFSIKLVWYLLRPIAIGAIVFYGRRWLLARGFFPKFERA